MKHFLYRVGIVGVAGFFALCLAVLGSGNVGAADPPPVGQIISTSSPTYVSGSGSPYFAFTGVGCANGNYTCLANAYGYAAYTNYGGYYPSYYGGYSGTPFYYNGSYNGQNIFTVNGCDTGNYTCLYNKGVTGYAGYNSYPYTYSYSSYPYTSGYTYPYTYGYTIPTVSYTYGGYFNGSYYSGLPNSYFSNAGCAVGNYTCLFANSGGNLSNNFFTAVGCPIGNYTCATNDVFARNGCPQGNYACVFGKTGVSPAIADPQPAEAAQPVAVTQQTLAQPATAASVPAATTQQALVSNAAPVQAVSSTVAQPASVPAPAAQPALVQAPATAPQAVIASPVQTKAIAAPSVQAVPGDTNAADRG